MSTEDEYNIATRYRTVRKHLDSLGYKQALTFDALPLIEKLLADLIQTTESLKHFKNIAQENIEAHIQLQSTIDPYKCDNVRLVQECNQLHSDLIKEKESHQKQIKDLKKEIYKLERECNDLQLSSSRNLHRIKELETESAKKSKRILELQGKCLKPTISNVGLASKKRSVFPLRRPVIESEPLPKTGIKFTPLPNLSIVEPKIIDLLNMADHKMNCLSHEVTNLKGELSLQNDNVQILKSQLTTKEKEILRLKKMLEGGRPYLAVSKDYKKTENNYVISDNVNDELKILQQEKLELEQQLKEALNKQHDAMSQALKLADRNEELEKELKDIDYIALAVEADCNSTVKENNKRVSKLQEKLENVTTRVHVLEDELTTEHREVQELRTNLETCRLEKLNIQRTLECTLDEKKQMTDRINELTVIEKNLNDEIERLAKENEKQKQDIIQLQYSNKLLKEQMNAKDILLDNNGTNETKEKGRKNNYNKEQNSIDFQEIHKETKIFQDVNHTGHNNILKQLDGKDIETNLQQAIEQLRNERDFYKNEYKNIKDNYNKTIEIDHVDFCSRIRELKCHLNEKENALDKLQQEKRELCREKTNLETHLHTYKNEHKTPHRLCNVCKRGIVCNCSPLVIKDSKIKDIIERLEHERDIARADIDRLIEERNALRERLKIATEAHTSEQRHLRENLTDVETRLKQIEKERQELLLTQGTRRATIKGLEDQLQDLREELRRTKQELGTQRTQYFQLRALQDQTDQTLGDAQNQLTQSESELNKVLDRNKTIERQKLQLENQIKDLEKEINNLKVNMTHLDHEKDQLLMVLDEKTEKIAALEKEIVLKGQQIIGNEQQIRDLQHKNEMCVDQTADANRQLRSIQLEMENLQRQLQTVSYDRDNAIQENRRTQDDLAAATSEVRNLQRELETSRGESFDLKRQLQTYVSEVRRAEELLNRKENERSEMLNHFRSLSLEATVLENNNHSLESEAAEARGALKSARDRLLDLERQLADKDSLIRGYETQISELTQNVASLETQLRQQGEQKHRAEADLTAVRDLCMKLDEQKDTLMAQLDDKDSLKTQYDMQIAKLKAEQAVIQDQMTKDRATVERLEMLLDQARQESITAQTNNQELQNEMSRLRQKMSELQTKLSSESTKLRQYQTQAAEYSKQISELRRQVTNERFDRARKEEESRRPCEETPDPPVQVPCPKSYFPNETNETKYRSLNSTPDSFNNETSKEYDGLAERSRMKIINPVTISHSGYLNLQNYRRNNHAKHIHCDVPCINIILRSDCKMHSSLYNYLQKENAQQEIQNESAPLFQINENSMKVDFKPLNTSQFNSFNGKYNHTAFNTENCFNVSQLVGMQYEKKYNQGQSEILNKDKIKTLNADNDIESRLKVNEFVKYHAEFCKELSTKSFPIIKLEATKQINENIEVPKKKDSSLNFEKTITKNESVKFLNDLKLTTENIELKPTNNLSNFQLTRLENLLKPVTYTSSKKFLYTNYFRDPYITRNLEENNQIQNTICTNEAENIYKTNCKKYETAINYKKDKFYESTLENKFTNLPFQKEKIYANVNCNKINYSTLNIKQNETDNKTSDTKFMNHTFLKSTKDFDHSICENKCVNTIDNTLDVLQNMLKDVKKFKNKNMTKFNDQSYQFKEIQSKKKDNYWNETFNSSEMRLDFMQMLQDIKKQTETLEEQLVIMNKCKREKRKINEKLIYTSKNYNFQEKKNIITQYPEKKNICIQDSYSYCDLKCQCSLLKPTNNFYSQYEKQNIILLHGKKIAIDKNDKKKNINLQECRDDCIKKVKDIQIQCVKSLSFHILDSKFKLATSLISKKDCTSKNKKSLNYVSTCIQTDNSQAMQVEKIPSNELKSLTEQKNKTIDSVKINKKSVSLCCNKNAIILLILKKINNKCLKCKYKKKKFLHFKPKCNINSHIMYDQKMIKYRLSRVQIPIVFKSTYIRCKSEEDFHLNKNNYELCTKYSTNNCKISDLVTVCTQSSNLWITTATSISSTLINNNNTNNNNFNKEKIERKEGCTIS